MSKTAKALLTDDVITLAEIDAIIEFCDLPVGEDLDDVTDFQRGDPIPLNRKFKAVEWSTGGSNWKGVVMIGREVVPILEFFAGTSAIQRDKYKLNTNLNK